MTTTSSFMSAFSTLASLLPASVVLIATSLGCARTSVSPNGDCVAPGKSLVDPLVSVCRRPDVFAAKLRRKYGRRSGKRFRWQQQIIGPLVCIGFLDRSNTGRRVRAVQERATRRRRKRRKVIIVVTAAAVAVVAGIAAVIVTVVAPGGNANSTGFVADGKLAAADAEQITSAFLQAWQTGDLGQAARYTDHPAAASAALAAYSKYLHLRKLTATALSGTVAPSGTSSTPRESVGYAIKATVAASDSAKALSGTWSYQAIAGRLPAAELTAVVYRLGTRCPGTQPHRVHSSGGGHGGSPGRLGQRCQRERPHLIPRRRADDDRGTAAEQGAAGAGKPGPVRRRSRPPRTIWCRTARRSSSRRTT